MFARCCLGSRSPVARTGCARSEPLCIGRRVRGILKRSASRSPVAPRSADPAPCAPAEAAWEVQRVVPGGRPGLAGPRSVRVGTAREFALQRASVHARRTRSRRDVAAVVDQHPLHVHSFHIGNRSGKGVSEDAILPTGLWPDRATLIVWVPARWWSLRSGRGATPCGYQRARLAQRARQAGLA